MKAESSIFGNALSWVAARRGPKRLIALLASGLVLAACILPSQLLVLPASMESIGRLAYRGAFLLVLPARPFAAIIVPYSNHHWTPAHYVAACLMAPFLYLLAYTLLKRLYHHWTTHRAKSEVDVSRRKFLARSASGMAGVAVAGVGGHASLVAPARLKVERYDMPIQGLPPEFDGLRLVHVSDTHYGPFTSKAFLEKAAEQANALDGDLVVMTGDYVHFTPDSIEPGIALLENFQARYGSVAVMGNHEFWEGVGRCRRQLDRIGVPRIDNDRLFLTPDGLQKSPVPGHSLCVAGLTDHIMDEISFDKALHGVPDDMPRLLLSHNPDPTELVPREHRVDLMLAGHTHGGQINLPLVGPPPVSMEYGTKYIGGLCQGPRCPVVVSRGIGIALLPLRFRVPPELVLVTLHRQA
ncbi:MAG: hypothetical protein GWP08_05400 [Nitrospiraceae bacterium]|nr:hypothetical protein [Nitrospiraceae bacterium]